MSPLHELSGVKHQYTGTDRNTQIDIITISNDDDDAADDDDDDHDHDDDG